MPSLIIRIYFVLRQPITDGTYVIKYCYCGAEAIVDEDKGPRCLAHMDS